MTKTLEVKCPECGTSVQMVEAEKYRPFCSHRCQRKDFGDWASEANTIAGSSLYDDVLSDDLLKE